MAPIANRSLESILKDLSDAKKVSETELDTIPLAGRPGMQMAIRQAKADIPKLLEVYQQRVYTVMSVYFPFGDPAKCLAFADLAAKEGGAVKVDADRVYREIATKYVELTLGRTREFGTTQLLKVAEGLREVLAAAGYPNATFQQPKLKDVRAVPTVDHTVAYVREICENSFGTELTLVFIKKDLTDLAFATQFAGKVFRAVILNASDAERANLAGAFRRVTPVDVDSAEAIDEAFVAATFTGRVQPKKPATPPAQ